MRHAHKYYLLQPLFSMLTIKQNYYRAWSGALILSPAWREKQRRGE
ncbi:hypothetical protein UYSO10_2894 [Kosakonia radicincitans]|nr:hypothetical protein UYSO10_2894 [Kosakonia radicincitans]